MDRTRQARKWAEIGERAASAALAAPTFEKVLNLALERDTARQPRGGTLVFHPKHLAVDHIKGLANDTGETNLRFVGFDVVLDETVPVDTFEFREP